MEQPRSYLSLVPTETLCNVVERLPLSSLERLIVSHPEEGDRVKFCVRELVLDQSIGASEVEEILSAFPNAQTILGPIEITGFDEEGMVEDVRSLSRLLRGPLDLTIFSHTAYPEILGMARVRLNLYPTSDLAIRAVGKILSVRGDDKVDEVIFRSGFLTISLFYNNLYFIWNFLISLPRGIIRELRITYKSMSPYLDLGPSNEETTQIKARLDSSLTHLWVQSLPDQEGERSLISLVLPILASIISSITDLTFFSYEPWNDSKIRILEISGSIIQGINFLNGPTSYPSILRINRISSSAISEFGTLVTLFPSVTEFSFSSSPATLVYFLNLSRQYPALRFLDTSTGTLYRDGTS